MIIISLIHNQLEMTQKFIQSILESRDCRDKELWEGCKLILVDNGSEDNKILSYLKQVEKDNKDLGNIEVIRNEENKYFTIACQDVIEQYPNEDIYLINNDIEVMDGWLEGRKHIKEWGMIGATQVYPLERDFITFMGGGDDFCSHKVCWKWKHEGKVDIHEETWLTFGACMINREAFDKVGGLDKTLLHYCSDSDLSLRIKMAGYKIGVSPKMIVAHWGSFTTKMISQSERGKVIMEQGGKDQVNFAEKHGIKIGGYIPKSYKGDKV
jgi:hypothetical protein